MSELRQDPTTKDWVIFATSRSRRPNEFSLRESTPPAELDSEDLCPFCPGNEHVNPPELERLTRRSGDTVGWGVRVVPNRFPALDSKAGPGRSVSAGYFRRMPGAGAHEIVIETPDHVRPMADMTDDEAALVFEVYRHRYRVLSRTAGLEVIVIFKNYGERAGASLRHPHSQIIGAPVETPLLRRQYQVARAHFAELGSCLYCDMRDAERRAAGRIVFETEHFVAIQPYASKVPYETWILPLTHQPSFGAVTDTQLSATAAATGRVLGLLRDTLGDPAYNYAIHSAPIREQEQPFFLWHIQIVPRLSTPAGFELGSGMMINSVLPEHTARVLRNLDQEAGPRING